MWRSVLTTVFVFINIYDPQFILLYVNINFFYSQLYFFSLDIKKYINNTYISILLCWKKLYDP